MEILIIEDDEALRRSLARHLRRRSHRIAEAGSCREARQKLREGHYDIVLSDVALPDGLGFSVVEDLTNDPACAVIVMTGDVQVDHAITALRHGATDFLAKPFSLEALDHAFGRVQSARRLETIPPPPTDDRQRWREEHCPEILGEDPTLLRTFDIVRRVADTECSVLITGETGTGKELFARAIHRASSRSGESFVPVNCASIPENLMESELFGHAKGAFTGASSAYKGRFAVADGGTLLLDEIGEMAMPLQAKLLRVLQEGEIRPVGEGRSQKIDVRIVAATHRDVEKMVDDGSFREDLLYRLDVIRIELPSLRERPGDIEVITRRFIDQAAALRKREIKGIEPDAMAALRAYPWPGNVRQLKHTIQRMIVLATGSTLTLEDVPPRIRKACKGMASSGRQPILPEDGLDLKSAVEEFENALIRQALERTGWNKNQAASILQMNRTTLVEKLKKKGLAPGRSEVA